MEFCNEVIYDPECFEINRMKAHSDHKYYSTVQDISGGQDGGWTILLSGEWKFAYADHVGEVIPGFWQEDYDSRCWERIKVPSSIQLQGYDRLQYVDTQYPWDGLENVGKGRIPVKHNPIGMYIREFDVEEKRNTGRYTICFEGVESAFAVWVNGTFVGYSEDSFTPSEFDVTQMIRQGKNKIAVQVFKWCSGSILESQDFFRMSGIFRDVVLRYMPVGHIYDLKIIQRFQPEYKKAELEIIIEHMDQGCYRKRAVLAELGRKSEIVSRTESVGSRMVLTVDNPRLWSAENPFLYELRIEVEDQDGKLVEVVSQKTGLREFLIKDGIMCLNGKRIIFNGVNRHELSCVNGRSLTEEEIRRDILIMKRNNINAVRTSHYPNQSIFYDLCDEYGLYVMDETNLESHADCYMATVGRAPIEDTIPGSMPQWHANVLDRAESMYQRDKNHCSILIWSCGNESCGGKNLFDMSEYFRKNDPFRPVHYEGITFDNSYPGTSDLKSFMYAPAKNIEEYLKKEDDRRPVLSCEYMHSMGNSTGGLGKYMALSDRYARYQGGFIWDFADQSFYQINSRGERYLAYGGDFGDRPNNGTFCGNGLLYADRKETPKLSEVKFQYQTVKILPQKNKIVLKNKNLFTDLSAFVLEVSIADCDQVLVKREFRPVCPPLSECETDISMMYENIRICGEYTVTARLRLAVDTAWAKAGYETAFGQFIAKPEEYEETEMISDMILDENNTFVCLQDAPVQITDGLFNIGVRCGKIEMLFSKEKGGLVSYKIDGNEMMISVPVPNFWRAPTDNDKGSGMPLRCAKWKTASMYAVPAPAVYKILKDTVEISYHYYLFEKEDESPGNICEVIYRVIKDGTLKITMRYSADESITNHEMPEFGMLFRIPGKYGQVYYYGKGPDENYEDRSGGSRLGHFTYLVKENLSDYLMPQESGGRTGVRKAVIVDEQGYGIQLCSEEMNFSALPYTPDELECARHKYELPQSEYTILRPSLRQMGVGGDDSWKSKPHRPHLLDEKGMYEFTFYLKGGMCG